MNKNIISTNTISITNKSKKGVTTIIAASSQGKKTSCGQFSLTGKTTIIVNVSCDVSGSTFSLTDSDGRSNALDFSSSSPPPPRDFLYAFVTDETFNGNLGGVSGAKNKCSFAANTGGLEELKGLKWNAWISTGTINAIEQFDDGDKNLPYYLPDDIKLVDSLNTLTMSQSLLHELNINESGSIVTSDEVWTNTDGAGVKATADTCDNFNDGTNNWSGVSGLTTKVDSTWTYVDNPISNPACYELKHIYCFETRGE